MEITRNWRFFIGIDISKKWLDIHLFDHKTSDRDEVQLANTNKGFERLGQWLAARQIGPSKSVLVSEHTGRYGEQLLRWTTENEWMHAVVKTTALQKVGFEHHRKTDAYDAQQLAEYGWRFEDKLQLAKADKQSIGQLKRLQAERRAMVDRRAALKSKLTEADLHDANMDQIKEMWTQQISLLSEHISEIEDQIETIINQDPALKHHSDIMDTAPGMGSVLKPLWLSLFGSRKKLDPRKISSRFGFAPHPHRSGSSLRGSNQSSGFGHSEMRKVMYQAAICVKTHYPHYQNYYQKKRAEGKPHLLVMNNIINKLIRLYCAMWNKQEEYDPEYIRKKWNKSA